jgi:predicted extracellular nuclease
LLFLLTLLASCQELPITPTAAPLPAATETTVPDATRPNPTVAVEPAIPQLPAGTILISELLTGVPGDNNREFIELYNPNPTAVDLDGWTLTYRFRGDEQPVFQWDGRADIPAQGHLLLLRSGAEFEIAPDFTYEVPLFERQGVITLRDPAGVERDVLHWGDWDGEIQAAPAPTEGASLERSPGGADGNGVWTGDNAADFALNLHPDPQNSGSDATPLPDARLALQLGIPKSVAPGQEFPMVLELVNHTGRRLENLSFYLPLPADFEPVTVPDGAEQVDGWLLWTLASLPADGFEHNTITLQSPWSVMTTDIRGAYVETADGALRAYAGPAAFAVTGGPIPIANARTLPGSWVTIEGTATMYTGGYYAGSTGTKFYLQDETGGIQVYCPGAQELVEIAIGDRVRVTGGVEVYRNAVEIVPGTFPDDIEVLAQFAAKVAPTPITLQQAGEDEAVLGRLNAVEGILTRVDEFSYSYELDLTAEDSGLTQLVYIEKETGISVEPLIIGERYRVVGISEMYDTLWELKPRHQADLQQLYPPELAVAMAVPPSASAGSSVAYTLTVTNHTPEALTDIRVEVPSPTPPLTLVQVLDGGRVVDGTVVWTLAELAPDGGSVKVRFTAQLDGEATGRFTTQPAAATATEWPTPAYSHAEPVTSFVGYGVPVWAIQGDSGQSPYVRSRVSTEGIVTGLFPGLGGFWIQGPADGDRATSDGLFVQVPADVELDLAAGDLARLTGAVREVSGQTLLAVAGPEHVTVVSRENPLPAAVELDPPADRTDALVYYEALEGMLVQVTEPAVVVAPTTKYGETALVKADRGVERIMQGGADAGYLIFVDDGAADTYYDGAALPFAAKTGDLVTSVTGPLAYTFDVFKIEPIAPPVVVANERPLPTLVPAGPGEFSVATLNVENLFDFQAPHPSDPPMPTSTEYRERLAKLAATVVSMGAPSVVALQEVEHLGVLEDLLAEEALADYEYEPILIEGTDSRGIDVGYLVRTDQVTLMGAAAYPAPEGLASRPPLMITVTLKTEDAPTLYLLNNHFTSMSGGEEATEPRRDAQARWNLTLVERILAREPEALVVVTGDLNSFYDAKPIDSLRQGGLRHVFEALDDDRILYTYIYLGESETLDHILVTPALYEKLRRVEVLHVNADYPLPLPGDLSARHVSDHDPLVAVFGWSQ